VSCVDLHCHVLPGVDDGAPDLETSLEMLRAAAAAGTSVMVATPHQHPTRYPNPPEPLRAAFALLSRAREDRVAAGETLPELHLGAEVHLDDGLVERLKSGELLTLAGGPSVLLELPDVFPTAGVERLLYELQVAGFQPVLAHPERVGRLVREPRLIERFVTLGALAQVTAHSVAGRFGPECRALTHRLLQARLVHVVASDAHDLKRRPAPLDEARAVLSESFGEEEATRLLEDAPRAILEGRELIAPPPSAWEPEPAQGWWARLFGRGRRD
jgi:protein-tyrosine phosphatase